MQIPKDLGKGNAHLWELETLFTATNENFKLGAFKIVVVDGGDGSSTVPGISAEDSLVSVVNLTTPENVTATAGNGQITYSGDLTDQKLLVFFVDVSALA